MFIEFNQMPDTSRVWVYQAGRPFTSDEERNIVADTQNFLVSWTVHNQTLKASCQIVHHQFLILAVDEGYNAASGCSIDKSVRFMQEMEQQYHISFFDRTQQAFLINDTVQLIALKDIKQAVDSGQITSDTSAFNNLVNTIDQLQTEWLKPAGNTWLSRYFKPKTVSA